MHQAVSRFGLCIRDIVNMKFGEKKKVILMDRNVGDYIGDLKGSFDPAEVGFSYGTYIHGENLTGLLSFDDVGVIHAPFTWEINLAALGPDFLYWGPLDSECCGSKGVKIQDLDPNILVGWRGPAIWRFHLADLPKKIRIYDTWWDDYGVSKYHNWLTKDDSE